MVLPIYKLISFAIKVISKPMANYSKQYHIEKNKIQTANWLSYIFKNLGYLDYRFQNWVDRKIMKIRTSYKEEKVNEEVAI